jgi:hypothetical protein
VLWQVAPGLPELLLWRSATVVGFFLLHYTQHYKAHLRRLVSAWQSGKLHVAMDPSSYKCARLTVSGSSPFECRAWQM